MPVVLGIKKDKRRLTSDGNLVNLGNFDSNGLNVNRNRPDNWNDNLGVVSSEVLGKKRDLSKTRFCLNGFIPAAKHFAYFMKIILIL